MIVKEKITQKKPTSNEQLEEDIQNLRQNADAWLNVPISERVLILENIIREVGELMESWVALSLEVKQVKDDPYSTGLEWVGGPMSVLRYLRGLIRSLKDLEQGRSPRLPGGVHTRPDGRLVANIYPGSLYERIVTTGVTVDVVMQAGISAEAMSQHMALAYQEPGMQGRLALVLGAGNIAAIPVLDSLYKLFVENQVVILKMNPVNEYIGPLIEKSHQELKSRNFLRVVYGGAEVGTYLSQHPGIDEIHLTGSDRTYEAVVFGGGPDGNQRKQEHQPLVTKRFTAELGNIGPEIVVPGPWSGKELHYQAEQIVSNICDNVGFSCSRARVVLTHAGWDLHDQLLAEIRQVMACLPARAAYYPGAEALYNRFLQAHPEAETFGQRQGTNLPWAFISGLDPEKESDICFQVESFCPVLAETSLSADSIPEFIEMAVKFANQRLWGTLTASIIIHPGSLKLPGVVEALEKAINDLHYGAIVVNGLGGMTWAMTTPPWGSFPGNDLYDIQSGSGFSNNAFMFSGVEKVVVRAPFTTWPKPIWFNSQGKTFARVVRKVAYYDLAPSYLKLPGIVLAAIQS